MIFVLRFISEQINEDLTIFSNHQSDIGICFKLSKYRNYFLIQENQNDIDNHSYPIDYKSLIILDDINIDKIMQNNSIVTILFWLNGMNNNIITCESIFSRF